MAKSEGSDQQRSEAARLLGRKGGRARSAKLTQQQRSEIARKASTARWANKKKAK